MNIWNTRVELTSICEINIHIILREYNTHLDFEECCLFGM